MHILTPDCLVPFLKDVSRIGIAVSGGVDSMVLCHLLHRWQQHNPAIALYAATVDHQLRPDSTAEASNVGIWLKDWDIPHTTLPWQHPPIDSNIHARARAARYQLLHTWAQTHNLTHVILGHHQDDVIETFLINLARGSGVYGLSAMPAICRRQGITLCRPLLPYSRVAIALYAAQHAIPHLHDPSNLDPRFTRTTMRQLLPVLEQHGIARHRLALAASNLQRAATSIRHAVSNAWQQYGYMHPCGAAFLSSATLALPDEIRLRLLAATLQAVSGTPTPPRLQSLLRLDTAMRTQRCTTLHHCLIEQSTDGWQICADSTAAPAAVTLPTHRWANWQIIWHGARPAHGSIGVLGQHDYPHIAAHLSASAKRIPYHARLAVPCLRQHHQIMAIPALGYYASPAWHGRFSTVKTWEDVFI